MRSTSRPPLTALCWVLLLLVGCSLTGRGASMPAEPEGGKPKYQRARDYWDMRRSYPNERVDWAQFHRAEQHRDRMPSARVGRGISAQSGPNASWEFVGPRGLTVPYRTFFGQGYLSGRVNAIAYSPSNESTYYAGAAGGGLWKSTDAGITWICLSDPWRPDPATPTQWENGQVSSIAVTAGPDGDILYVGTGDFDGMAGGEARDGRGNYGFGVMKSSDGGQTWTRITNGGAFTNTAIRRILIYPEDPNLVLVTTGRGGSSGRVYRSTDAGSTWNTVVVGASGTDWTDLAASAPFGNGERFLYTIGHALNGGDFYRSGDRGLNWTRIQTPLLLTDGIGNPMRQDSLDLATSPTTPGTMYLLSGIDRNVWRSTDSGQPGSWQQITSNLSSADFGQRTYDWYIEAIEHPLADTDILLVGLTALWGSSNGGASWVSVGETETERAEFHYDQHALAPHPFIKGRFLVGNDGGAYEITWEESGFLSFRATLNETLGLTQFYHAAFHPWNSEWMLGGTQDNATPTARGDLYHWDNFAGGDGAFAAIHQVNPEIQYASSQQGAVYQTTDSWNATKSVIFTQPPADGPGFIAPMVLDPSNQNLLYCGSRFLGRWNDNTNTYTGRLGNTFLAGQGQHVSAIAIAPSDANVIYTGASDGQISVSRNQGSNWANITPGLPAAFVTSITVNPNNKDDILVSLAGPNGAVWRNANTNFSGWTRVSGSSTTALPAISINSVCRDPRAPDKIWYAGSDVGVHMTLDGGTSWMNMTAQNGLPNVQVNLVEYVPGTGYLMAATYGRGIWRIRPSDVGAIGDGYEPDSNSNIARVIPNGEFQQHSFHVPEDSDWVKIDVGSQQSINAQTWDDNPGKVQLFLFVQQFGNWVQLADATEDGDGVARIIRHNLEAGTYYIGAQEEGQNSTIPTYTLQVLTGSPGQLPDDYEIDHTYQQANAIGTDGSYQNHNIHYQGDYDWVYFDLAERSRVLVETGGFSTIDDTVVTLFGSDGATFIAENDDGAGVGRYSRLQAGPLDPGRYYVRVHEYADNELIPSYTLKVTATTGFLLSGHVTESGVGIAAEIRFYANPTSTEVLHTVQSDADTGYWSYRVADGAEYYFQAFKSGYGFNTAFYLQDIGTDIPGLDFEAQQLPPQPQPSGFGALAFADTQVLLYWTDQGDGETGFELRKGTGGAGGSFQPLAPLAPESPASGQQRFYLATNLTPNTQYWFQIQALPGSPVATVGPVKTLAAGQRQLIPFKVIVPKAPKKAKVNKVSSVSVAVKNPYPFPIPVHVSQPLTAPFEMTPGPDFVLPARTSRQIKLTFKFRPTSRTPTIQTANTVLELQLPGTELPLSVTVEGRVK